MEDREEVLSEDMYSSEGEKGEIYDFEQDDNSQDWMTELFKLKEKDGEFRKDEKQVYLFHTCTPEFTWEISNSNFPYQREQIIFLTENLQLNNSAFHLSIQNPPSFLLYYKLLVNFPGEGFTGRFIPLLTDSNKSYSNKEPKKCIIEEFSDDAVSTSSPLILNNNQNAESSNIVTPINEHQNSESQSNFLGHDVLKKALNKEELGLSEQDLENLTALLNNIGVSLVPIKKSKKP